MSKASKIPSATLNRIPMYLRALGEVKGRMKTISSAELAMLVGVQASQLRKDFSYFGEFGVRGIGYDIEHLERQLSSLIGLTTQWKIALVGAGRLGQALVHHGDFKEHNLVIAALFDNDLTKIGKKVAGMVVNDVTRMPDIVKSEGIKIGIIATPADSAQLVADQMVRSGIKAILNFTSAGIDVPPDIVVRNVDLAIELQVLLFRLMREELKRSSGERQK